MKPDWKDAPEWAQWLAQDRSGSWYWFEKKPKHGAILWSESKGRIEQAFHRADNWKSSLESRPAASPI